MEESYMLTNLNKQALEALLKDFYLLTKIKIVVFDTNYHELIAYPDSHCAYCQTLREYPECKRKCMESNIHSFEQCRKTSEMMLYHCHAGLIEATAPLIDNGIIIGYIMFGQITDTRDDTELHALITDTLKTNNIAATCSINSLLNVERKSEEQIFAAAKILEACTFYVLLKEIMYAHRQNFADNLNTYLLQHLSEELSAEQIAADFGISRSKLYATCEKYLGIGIGLYIKRLRLEKAKSLLKETALSISEISHQVGFADYNYFCRVFKQEIGIPAKKYRALFT